VKENECINNQYLFNGNEKINARYSTILIIPLSTTECSFVLTPSGEFNTLRLILNIIAVAGSATTAQTLAMNSNNVADAVVTLRGTAEHTQLNSSTCQISIASLEVYRGRQQAIEISHQGFSLSDNGTIQVHQLL
jgi:hypothetical protein